MKIKSLNEIPLKGKIIFLRSDMNVPLNEDGSIADDTRIRASLPTIQYALSQGANVLLATHLGRPKEGSVPDPQSDVKVIAKRLAELLKLNIPVLSSLDTIDFTRSNILMLQNVRLNPGEKANDPALGKKYSLGADIFVHDAFATAHRKEASTDAIGKYLPSFAGLLFTQELQALTRATENPVEPIVAIIGGSKVSTKTELLENIIKKVNYLIPGGGILNNFLLQAGYPLGKSLVEVDLLSKTKELCDMAKQEGVKILLPDEVRVAKEFHSSAAAKVRKVSEIQSEDIVMDVGPSFEEKMRGLIASARTIIWNGPLGVFEFPEFASGTKALALAIAANKEAYSIAGGGDTIACLNKFKLFDQLSYVSTAGGAMLEFMEGKTLPAIALLMGDKN